MSSIRTIIFGKRCFIVMSHIVIAPTVVLAAASLNRRRLATLAVPKKKFDVGKYE